MLSWPVENQFPQKLLLSGEEQLNDNSISSEMEVGPPARRLRDTVEFSIWSGQIVLNYEQRLRMKRFWQSDSRNGTIPFLWCDPLTREATTYLLVGPPIFTTLGGGVHMCSITIREVPE